MPLFKEEKITCLTAHGKVDAVHAIAHSCNVYFATASKNLSQTLFLGYASKLGLNSAVGPYKADLFPKAEKSHGLTVCAGLSPHLHPNGLQLMRLSAIVAHAWRRTVSSRVPKKMHTENPGSKLNSPTSPGGACSRGWSWRSRRHCPQIGSES